MRITIENTTNGYLLEWDEETENGFVKQKIVIEEKEDFKEYYKTKDEEKIALGDLLTRIAEFFGFHYDKWNNENLDIKFNLKGHKLD